MYICQIIGSVRAKVREGRREGWERLIGIPWGSEGMQRSLNQDDSLADNE
jgi:hypothetical protein